MEDHKTVEVRTNSNLFSCYTKGLDYLSVKVPFMHNKKRGSYIRSSFKTLPGMELPRIGTRKELS